VPLLLDEMGRFGVLVIETVSGVEIRIPLRDSDCIADGRPRIDRSHTDQAVHH